MAYLPTKCVAGDQLAELEVPPIAPARLDSAYLVAEPQQPSPVEHCRRRSCTRVASELMRLPRRLAALRKRNYRLFFTGQALSTLGDSTTPVAISFAILDRGGTAAQIGWVLGAGCWVLGAGCGHGRHGPATALRRDGGRPGGRAGG